MRKDIGEFTIVPPQTIREAMAAIGHAVLGIVLVSDAEGHLLGTLTDGDVRRAILDGHSIDGSCTDIMCREPTTVGAEVAEEDVLGLMRKASLRHVPVVDDDGRVLGLHIRSDIVGPAGSGVPAVVMAGGLGTRLGDLTTCTPKPLVSVGGKPILQHVLEHLKEGGVEDVIITTRHLAGQIEGYFGDGQKWGVAIRYVREQQRLGTAGALKYLQGRLERHFLVMNADLLTDFPVQEFEHFHMESGAAMTVAVRHHGFQVPFGVVDVDGARVVGLSEKPRYEFFVNAGVYMLDPATLQFIPEGESFDMTQLVDVLLREGWQVCSFPILERWIDIGRPEDLERAEAMLGDPGAAEPEPGDARGSGRPKGGKG